MCYLKYTKLKVAANKPQYNDINIIFINKYNTFESFSTNKFFV